MLSKGAGCLREWSLSERVDYNFLHCDTYELTFNFLATASYAYSPARLAGKLGWVECAPSNLFSENAEVMKIY